jgi:hypothetical protein
MRTNANKEKRLLENFFLKNKSEFDQKNGMGNPKKFLDTNILPQIFTTFS